jgi:hypothetical protein
MAEMKPVAGGDTAIKVATLASTIKDAQRNAQPLALKATDDACLIAAAMLLAADDSHVIFRQADG